MSAVRSEVLMCHICCLSGADLKPFVQTDRDIIQVVSQLGGTGYSLSISDPLLQLLYILVELVEPVLLLQLGLPVLHHVLQGHIQPVYVRLLLGDMLTVRMERKATCPEVLSKISTQLYS